MNQMIVNKLRHKKMIAISKIYTEKTGKIILIKFKHISKCSIVDFNSEVGCNV